MLFNIILVNKSKLYSLAMWTEFYNILRFPKNSRFLSHGNRNTLMLQSHFINYIVNIQKDYICEVSVLSLYTTQSLHSLHLASRPYKADTRNLQLSSVILTDWLLWISVLLPSQMYGCWDGLKIFAPSDRANIMFIINRPTLCWIKIHFWSIFSLPLTAVTQSNNFGHVNRRARVSDTSCGHSKSN